MRPFNSQREGFPTPLIVSRREGASKSASIIVGEPVFITWAVENAGPRDITQPFFIDLYLDGALVTRWPVNSRLRDGWYLPVRDWPDLAEWTSLDPGTHTLTLVADPTDLVHESDESDNSFSLQILVEEPSSQPEAAPLVVPKLPNLTPFSPKGWDAPILTYSKVGDETFDVLSVDVPTCIRVAFENAGLSSVQGPTVAHLYLDDLLIDWRWDDSVGAGFSARFGELCELREVVPIGPGTHILRLEVDATNLVDEASEEDNVFETEFVWRTGPVTKISLRELSAITPPLPGKPNLKPFLAPGWDGAAVLRPDEGVFSPTLLVAGQPAYYHWAVENDSGVDMQRGYQLELLLGGELIASLERPPLEAGAIDFDIDVRFSTDDLSPAQGLKFALTIDPDDKIDEENEQDNTYESEVQVLSQPPVGSLPTSYTADELQVGMARLEDLLLITDNVVSPAAEPSLSQVIEVMDAVYFALYGTAFKDEQVYIHTLTEEEYDSWITIRCRDVARRLGPDGEEENFEECALRLAESAGFQSGWREHERIIMRGEVTPARLIEIFAHELGHFRQAVVNPDNLRVAQRTLNVDALKEAEAYAHTMMVLRELEERLGKPLLLYPDLTSMTRLIDNNIEHYLDRKDEDEHERGILFLWSAVLGDENLTDLKEELLQQQQLGLDGTKRLFDYLVDIAWEDADAYVGGILARVNEHLPTIRSLSEARLVAGLSYLDEGSPAFQEAGLLLP